jgi:hypothetical protein
MLVALGGRFRFLPLKLFGVAVRLLGLIGSSGGRVKVVRPFKREVIASKQVKLHSLKSRARETEHKLEHDLEVEP